MNGRKRRRGRRRGLLNQLPGVVNKHAARSEGLNAFRQTGSAEEDKEEGWRHSRFDHVIVGGVEDVSPNDPHDALVHHCLVGSPGKPRLRPKLPPCPVGGVGGDGDATVRTWREEREGVKERERERQGNGEGERERFSFSC